MMEFEESNLSFKFSDEWQAVQYDQLPEYVNVCRRLQGTKGIDFLTFHNNSMILFEIKNFRGYGNNSNTRFSNAMEVLTTQIAQKVKDTVALIAGIGRTANFENPVWDKAFKHLNSKKEIIIIAWIEEDISSPVLKKRKKQEMNVRTRKLQQKLAWLTACISIDNVKEQHFRFSGFSVTSAPNPLR
ncbi:MAG: hypothetical protein ACOC30_02955 [Marinilabilia sp.]